MSFSSELTWPKRAIGGGNHLIGTVTVRDRRLDSHDVTAKLLAGNQPRRIVFAGVDAKTGTEPVERNLQLIVRPLQDGLRDERTDIRVDTGHDGHP